MPKRACTDVASTSADLASSTTQFKWKPDDKLRMAEYLVEHFETYKNLGEKGGKKLDFLRKMKQTLEFGCTDQQLKNGFSSFLNKYYELRAKLNSSGFGVDPTIDVSLDKGWVMKQCPYFEVLDKVLGTRPNVTPPFILVTTEIGQIGSPTEPETSNDPISFEVEEAECLPIRPAVTTTDNTSPVASIIKSSFSRIGIQKTESQNPKTGIAAFTKLIQDKATEQYEVESKKLKLEEQKFEHQKEIEMHRLQLEMVQMDKAQMDREMQSRQLEDKKEERAHELRKLELQIELEKLRSKANINT